jgi:hypothetical protein
VDQGGVQLVENLLGEAEPREPADPVVLDHHVGVPQQRPEHRTALLARQVEPNAALVPVDR